MNIQAEMSLYPLRTRELAEPIKRFLRYLRQMNLEVEMGTMSSRISGECKDLFPALGIAFEEVADEGEIVLIVKVSNACPLSEEELKKSQGNSLNKKDT